MEKDFKPLASWLPQKKLLATLLLVALALIATAIYFFAKQNKLLQTDFTKQIETIKLLEAMDKANQYLEEGELGLRAYALTGDRSFIENLESNNKSIRRIYESTRVADYMQSTQVFDSFFIKMDNLLDKRIELDSRIITFSETNNFQSTLALITASQALKLEDSASLLNTQMRRDLREHLQISQTAFTLAKNKNNNFAYAGIIGFLLVVAMAIFLLARELRRFTKMSEQLQQGKDVFKMTFNSIQEGLICTDEEGRVNYLNPSAEKLTGWQWQDAKNQPLQQVFNVVNEATGKPLNDIVNPIIKDRGRYERENNTILHSRHTGKYVISNSGAPITDAEGNVTGAVLVFSDITERKNAEKQLLESARQYRELIQTLPEAVYTCDENGYIQLYNKASVILWGREPVIGKDVWCGSWKMKNAEGIHLPANQSTTAISINEARPVHGIEIIIEQPSGGLRHALAYSSPMFDTEGKLTGAVNMLLDITDKMEREIFVRKSEEKYQALVNQAADAIFINDDNMNILEVNNSAASMLGFTKEELVTMQVKELYKEDELIVKPIMQTQLLSGLQTRMERNMVHKSGRQIPVEVTAKKLSDGRILAIVRDITERKKAEAALTAAYKTQRQIMESSLDGVICMNHEGFITVWNKQAESIFGWKASEVIGKTVTETIVPEYYRERHKKGLEQYLKTRDVVVMNRTLEIIALNSAGKEFPVELTIVPITDGEEEYFCSFIRDITERLKATRSNRENEKKLELIFNNTRDVIFLLTVSKAGYVFNAVNQSFYTTTGLKQHQVLGRFVHEVIPEPLLSVVLKNYETAIARKESFQWEETTEYPSGKKNGIISVTPIFNYQGNCTMLVGSVHDITERKKAEQDKEMLASILENTTDFVGISSPDLKILYANKAALQALQIDGSEAWQFKVSDFVPGSIKQSFFNYTLPQIFNEGRWEGETTWMAKDGAVIPVSQVIMLHKNEKGLPVYFSILARDITERKKAEEALAKSENHLRTIIQAEPQCVKLLDANGILEDMNPAGLAMIEADSLQQVKGHAVLELIQQPYQKAFHQLTRDVFKGRTGVLEFEIIGLKGTHRWLETHAVPLRKADGKVISLLSVTSDITDRKKAEENILKAIERYDILSQATSDTVWDWDIINNRILYNDGIKKRFGYVAAELTNVESWWQENVHADDLSVVRELLDDAFNKKLATLEMEYRFRASNGLYKYVFDRAYIIYDRAGTPTRMIGAMQDVTYRKEEELRISKAVIHAQEAERSHIGAELHDNVNQILATSSLYLGMAKDEQADPNKSFQLIQEGQAFINQAMQEVRKLSHELSPAVFNDGSLEEDFENLLNNFNADNRFAIDLQFDLQNIIPGDDVQLNMYRILQEQTKNISKYSEATNIEISVLANEQLVTMRIADNGRGFDVKQSRTGIGLSNIRRRIEAHNGKFILNSAPGKGCEIIVELPVGDS